MKFSPPKGMRDFAPENMIKKQKTVDAIRSVFERYGFSPMDTPALESFDMLSMKGSGDAIRREIYNFKDQGNRELGLRFDLTVSLARFLSNNPNMPKPFRRYAIGDVWRYDNPQASRWRQFTQADVDIVGSSSITADAECVSAAIESLEAVGLKDFVVRINNRKFLESILLKCGVGKNKIEDVFRIIDKMDKIGKNGVDEELKKLGVDAKEIFSYLGKDVSTLKDVDGYNELSELKKILQDNGFGKRVKIDISLVRGLEYYTGNVFEVVSSLSVSIGGGGRYDKLMSLYGAGDLPAVGMSIGIDRLIELLDKGDAKTVSKVFIAVIGDIRKEAFNIANDLRKKGISTSIELGDRNVKRQLEYASALAIPYVVVVGPDEIKNKTAKVRNMQTRKEDCVKLSELADYFSNI
ncbi:MAG: histidine--tRNA ligase [Candidatus Aenigmatarchaeota archaeon]